MCVILIATKVNPSLETLKQAETSNPDGGGFAYRMGDKIYYEKGLKASQIYHKTKDAPLPIVYHFRIATSGGKSKALCHPFRIGSANPISGLVDSVLFHNGNWEDWRQVVLQLVIANKMKVPGGDWSDSRAMAFCVSILGESFLHLIDNSRWGRENKIVLFKSNGNILCIGEFTYIKDLQLYASNEAFLRPKIEYLFNDSCNPYRSYWDTDPDLKAKEDKSAKVKAIIERAEKTLEEKRAMQAQQTPLNPDEPPAIVSITD